MNKNNLIRFAQSLLLLPFVTGTTVPLGSILVDATKENTQTVFIQKQNIEADGVLALNQVIDQKAKDLKSKADAIDAYFEEHNMPLEGTGIKMVQEAEKNGLDWRLLPAISVIESTGGRHACKNVTHSFFGWGSCKINFKSDDEAIETVAMNLGGNDPDTDQHYADKTTEQILKKYNSVIPTYAKKVIKVMDEIGNNIETKANV